MENKIVEGILKKLDSPDLIQQLANVLSPSELQSLLLAVFETQAAKNNPAGLLRNYAANRFTTPSSVDVKKSLQFDALAFNTAVGFEPIELAPVGPIGCCSVLGTVHQNKVVSALRNTEVLADSTNMMALEAALRRKALLKMNPKDKSIIQLCSSQRLVRAQQLASPDHTPHFRVFAMVSAGRDIGNFQFEIDQLREQLIVNLNLIQVSQKIDLLAKTVSIGITPLHEFIDRDKLQTELFKPIQSNFPEAKITFNDARENGRNYYRDICFNIDVQNKAGMTLTLGDGGFTDWTQQLLNNKKERLLISGWGSELWSKLFNS